MALLDVPALNNVNVLLISHSTAPGPGVHLVCPVLEDAYEPRNSFYLLWMSSCLEPTTARESDPTWDSEKEIYMISPELIATADLAIARVGTKMGGQEDSVALQGLEEVPISLCCVLGGRSQTQGKHGAGLDS
jgi:hypothetical protein